MDAEDRAGLIEIGSMQSLSKEVNKHSITIWLSERCSGGTHPIIKSLWNGVIPSPMSNHSYTMQARSNHAPDFLLENLVWYS